MKKKSKKNFHIPAERAKGQKKNTAANNNKKDQELEVVEVNDKLLGDDLAIQKVVEDKDKDDSEEPVAENNY
ncbi:MAG: hypothetical protein ABIN94_05965 [Ferruginibacter sp.]